jgi:hypothetical protein
MNYLQNKIKHSSKENRMAKEQRNMTEKNLKDASATTRNNFERSRTKFYEARFYAQDNPNSAAAKKALAAAEANMKRLGKIAYDESAKRSAAKRVSYSPTPMSAAAKAKAAAAGKATGVKTSARKPKAGTSTVSKVVGRAKTTAREARDVVTAVGTSARSRLNTRSYRSASGGLKSTPTSKANTAAADKNLKKQLKETAMAAMTGKKGTTSAQTGGKPSKKR